MRREKEGAKGMMDGNRNRRKVRDLVVTLPPPSASASSTNTPRALLRSLVSFPKYCIRKGKKGGNERDEEDEESVVGPTVLEGDSISPLQEEEKVGCEERNEEEEEEVAISSETKPEAVSFNLGIGVGLVFLLVNSASEFNKMIELRKQMEILLKESKGKMQRKNVTSSYSESNNYTVLCASNCWGDESTSNPISFQNAAYDFAGEHNGMVSDTKCVCKSPLEKKRCLEINQLEEELEAELERLQIKTEEDSSVLPQQQNMEFESADINHSESPSASFVGAITEPKQEDTPEHSGVCPLELERRLHELLESRQQERIAELETALECAERKLQEKETEICWWRDTARLVSKHKEVTLFR